eukprot:scaffold11579_cov40-Cyclotella_meneghiniana.AAC.13
MSRSSSSSRCTRSRSSSTTPKNRYSRSGPSNRARRSVTETSNPSRQSARIAQIQTNNANRNTSVNPNDAVRPCIYANLGCTFSGSGGGYCRHITSQCLFKNVVGETHQLPSSLQVSAQTTNTFNIPNPALNSNHIAASYQQWLNEDNPMEYHEYRTALCVRNRIETTADDVEEPCFDGQHDNFIDERDVMVPDPDFDMNDLLNDCQFGVQLNQGLISRHSLMKYDKYTAFQAHLLAEIMQYRKVPLCLFDTIMSTIQYHDLEPDLNFNNKDIYRSRKSLLQHLKKKHGMQDFKADIIDVPISLNRMAGCVRFWADEVIQRFFTDPRLFCNENIAEGYDVFTGRSEPSDYYGEIHTGKLFQIALETFRIFELKLMPVTLTMFMNETHTDNKGGLNGTLVTIQYSNNNEETRMKTYSSFPIGIIPNLAYGVSKDEKIDSCKKVQDKHDCLYVILQRLIKIKNQGGMNLKVSGRDVRAMPFIHLVIGDIKGHNMLGAVFNDNSGGTCLPSRMCYCTEFFNPEVRCEWFKVKDFIDAKKKYFEMRNTHGQKTAAKELMRSISRHPVKTVWERGVPLSSPIHGIYIAFPPELLHTFGVGYMPQSTEI